MEATEVRDAASPEATGAEKSPAGLFAKLAAWDLIVMRRLMGVSLPKVVAAPLIFLVRIGDGWIWCLIAVYLWRTQPASHLKTVVLHCVLAIAVSLAVYWPIKLLVKRQRPFVIEPGVTAKVPPLDKYSFPSGHTMNNLAVALTLALYVPHVFFIALFIPLLLGALRMLFGVHFLSDITGGATLGAASYLLAKWIFAFFLF